MQVQENEVVFSIHLTRAYLEVARAIAGPLELIERGEDESQFRNALTALVSITVVYSYLAVEAWVNNRLYEVWSMRREPLPIPKCFLEELGDEDDFASYKRHPKVAELKDRIKTLCRILGWKAPHTEIPATWNRFNDLSKKARHFMVHPYPDQEFFHEIVDRMLTEPLGQWVDTASEVFGFFFRQSGVEPPHWVVRSTLLRVPRVEVLDESVK